MKTEILNANGLGASSFLYFIHKHWSSGLIVLPAGFNIKEAENSLRHFTGGKTPVFSYPSHETGYDKVREDPQIKFRRIECLEKLSQLKSNDNFFVLTNAIALAQKAIPPSRLKNISLEIKKGEFIERDEFVSKLKALGYFKDDLAQDLGVFSVRGHLVDLYTPYDENPLRIEFFGDEIVSIRSFDLDTQRSLQEIESIKILPCRELYFDIKNSDEFKRNLKQLGDSRGVDKENRDHLLWQLENQREISDSRWLLPACYSELASFFDYLPEKKSPPILLVNPEAAQEEAERAWRREDEEYESFEGLAYGPSKLREIPLELWSEKNSRIRTELSAEGMSYQVLTHEELRPRLSQAKSFGPLIQEVEKLRDDGISTRFVISNEKRRSALQETLGSLSGFIEWQDGEIFSGFSSKTLGCAFFTERDIFGTRQKQSKASNDVSAAEFLRQFSDLNTGDYIVHEDHGIGLYQGLVHLDLSGVASEFVLIEYADSDKLYLPIYRLDQISRYVKGDGYSQPRLDKLGSQTFIKKRKKAREDILKIAHELIEIAAQRRLQPIERKPIDESAYYEFCQGFPFELTPDQEKAISDVEKDFTENNPMDRLVCGDVGFGKTEIALRAAMYRLLQGKQVAILAPTTLLAEQHYKNFHRRFKNFSFRVERLSRFVSNKEQLKTLDELKEGKVHLIVGTHRLLQRDVAFKDLGFLVVDEEQRFGVKHKEKIKKLRQGLDILTLSATPIPRTLQMSIVGIRDLSLIVSPPDTREAVSTFVGAFDEKLIREHSMREYERSGQILFVHNRVKSILGVKEKLQEILPELKIGVAHGQMPEEQLEDVMVDFMGRKTDLLLATSIIENGIDIPNANTIFIDHAEHFGLSDLYQIRGRVGRGHRKAYAYFLIHENVPITVEASKRLQVIQNCTELGSGFRVATHDLEIRGSGNLLGEAQSGVVAEVGLELYNQMLHEALSEIRNDKPKQAPPEMNSGYTAFIPDSYIPDASIRISTYRRLNQAIDTQDLLSIEDEILDRFGMYPREVDQLCQLIRIRCYAAALEAKSIDCFPGRLTIDLKETTPLQPEQILRDKTLDFSFDPKGRLVFRFESALHNEDLVKNTKFETPELYDFDLCRQSIKGLCKLAGLDLL